MSRNTLSGDRMKDMLGTLGRLFSEQRFAALATAGEEGAYASLVGFAAEEGLEALLFCTPRTTKKFANLLREPRAAMLVDNTSNAESDVADAMAVTATGRVSEVPPDESGAAAKAVLERFPALADFLRSPNNALMRMEVATYHVVRRFQDVVEVRMSL